MWLQTAQSHHAQDSKGITVAEYNSRTATGGGAPPPAAAPAANSGGGAAAVFAELNRGEEVTKGLRKVPKSEMTHKNPALRASSVVPSSPGSARRSASFYMYIGLTFFCFSSSETRQTHETIRLKRQET
jgi:hypothetical protein